MSRETTSGNITIEGAIDGAHGLRSWRAAEEELPELPWVQIAGTLEQIAIRILRFDARLDASGLEAGWQSRSDMTEAVRALLLDGHLVDVSDLVLHDAGMNVRHPTHELTRAAAALIARRTAMARKAPLGQSQSTASPPRVGLEGKRCSARTFTVNLGCGVGEGSLDGHGNYATIAAKRKHFDHDRSFASWKLQ